MSLSNMVKILVVGSGMTGCAAVALLRQRLPPDTDITIWDKARGAGGRMSTSRSSGGNQCTVDLGAQYITLTKQYQPKRQQLYNDLVAQGILAPMVAGSIEGSNQFDQDGAQHFVTPQGSCSLVKHYLQKSDAKMEYDRQVVSVKPKGSDSLTVTDTRGAGADFNAVVLTMPVPQILQFRDSFHKVLDSQRKIYEQLQGVNYSSRFALGLFYPPGTELPYTWSVKYLDNHPCIRFIAIDNKKRGVDGTNVNPSVVVHTHVQFGLQHLEEDKEQVKEIIMEHLATCLPDLPQPTEIKSQKWRYSQVHRGYPGNPGCLTLQKDPLIVLAGDSFTHSTFDGCLDSAEAVASTVTDYVNKSGKL